MIYEVPVNESGNVIGVRVGREMMYLNILSEIDDDDDVERSLSGKEFVNDFALVLVPWDEENLMQTVNFDDREKQTCREYPQAIDPETAKVYEIDLTVFEKTLASPPHLYEGQYFLFSRFRDLGFD